MTDTIVEEFNSAGDLVTGYYCEQLVARNEGKLTQLVVPYYYDLVYPCSENPAEGREFVAAALLSRSKNAFLEDTNVCVRPTNPWFAGVSSLPQDKFADFECQESTGPCCVVVEGSMTFTQVIEAKLEDMKRYVASLLNDPTIAPPYEVAFIGYEVAPGFPPPTPEATDSPNLPPEATDPPRNGLPNGVDGNRDPPPSLAPENNGFSMTGILILIGMIMAFIISILMIIKRRQRYLTGRDVDAAIAQSELNHGKDDLVGEHIETATWESEDLDINVLSDNHSMQIRPSDLSYRTGYPEEVQNSTGREGYLHRQYRFDLANSNRNDVMGAYGADIFGPTQITVVPPYPEESGSETDSWAQTDGTVGSLEDDHIGRETRAILGSLGDDPIGLETGEI